jgi:hypothetical protein
VQRVTSGSSRFRIRTALLGSALVVGIVAAACQPTKPPPSGPRDVDVLVVGDSIAAGLGCQLGDPGQAPAPEYPCSSVPGISAATEWAGACSISGGWLSQYNSTANNTPNCHDWPVRFQAFNAYNPEVVILLTGAWEIMDRWSSQPCSTTDTHNCAPPDRQWGNPDGTTGLAAAKAGYRAALHGVVDVFRGGGAKVIVVNSPYVKPPIPSQPVPIFWEAYGPQTPPFGWQSPVNGVPFGPSKIKVNNFNAEVSAAVAAYGDAANVQVFDAWNLFSPELGETAGGTRGYHPNVCIDLVGPNPLAFVTSNPNNPCPSTSQATKVRHDDGGHLTQQGYQLLLRGMLSQIQGMLGP